MATFWVKTHDDRNLIIEADSFQLDGASTATYKFYDKEGEGLRQVASVPVSGVFAVVEKDSWEADYYFRDFLEDEDE